MKRFLISTAVVALITGAVAADGVRFAQLTLDRTSYSSGDDDLAVTQFTGEVEYQIGDFLISGGVENTAADADDLDASVREISASGAYFITPEVLIGGIVTSVDNDVSDSTLAGAFAQYRNDQLGVGIRILQNLDTDDTIYLGVATVQVAPSVELGVGIISDSANDGTNYVISAEYDEGPISGRAYLAGDTDADDNIFGVRGAYEFGGTFRATGGFESISGGAVDYTSYNVGAGYLIADGAWIDASIGQIDRSEGDAINTLSLSVAFDTGSQTRLDRAFENQVRRDFISGGQQFTNALGALDF